MQTIKEDKHYNKNRLSKRIQRVSLVGNGVSTFIMLIFMMLIISALVGFLGKGFSTYTAKEIAEDVQQAYDESMNIREFRSYMEDAYVDSAGDEVASFDEARAIWVETGDLEKMDDYEVGSTILSNIRYFDYRIEFEGRVIYDSFEADTSMTKLDELNRSNVVSEWFFGNSTMPLYNEDQEMVGRVSVRLSSHIISMSYLIAISLALVILVINQIVNKIVSGFTSRLVSRPLENLADQMASIANEELEIALSSTIDIKKPVSEVTSLMASSDKIMAKMSEYYETMLAQNQELEAQKDVLANHRDELEAQTDELEAQKDELEAQKDELEASNEELVVTGNHLQSMNNAYLSRTLKLQNLMDNIGQGFMTFNDDLLLNNEYSVVCEDMVSQAGCGKNIQGSKVTDLLFEDLEQRAFMASLFVKIIRGTKHERDLFLPLLPEEIHLKGRVQKVEYKIVKDEKFKEQMMLILTDITHQRQLEEQMLVERDVLQMVVKVLLNREDFIELYDGYRAFVQGTFGDISQKNFDELLRTIHTFKGSFSQYYLTNISKKLNEEESKLYEANRQALLVQIDLKGLDEALAKDMDIIEAYVGKDFIGQKDVFTVKEEKVIEIEDKIRRVLPASEYNKVMPIIKSIRYKSVKDGLKTYPDYTAKLSERLGKSLAPFDISGDDVFVDFDVYQKVLKSMVHLFRNAVDHGIEDVDTRIEAGKSETATISCRVQKENTNTFKIIIEDDGRGIDVDHLVKKAIEEGKLSEDGAAIMSRQDKLSLVFAHGLTTKEEVTAVSGRGVGLAATKEMVELLGGAILVDSQKGQGTIMTVTLPILTNGEVIDFEPQLLLERTVDVASHYIDALGIGLGKASFLSEDRIRLHKVSAVLNVKGSVDGLIIVSSNQASAEALVNAFVIEAVPSSEIMTYAEDVLGEVTNTIMGNVLGTFEEDGVYLNLGVPVMISNESAYIKYSNRQILTAMYEAGDYALTINLLLTDSGETGLGWASDWLENSDDNEGGL